MSDGTNRKPYQTPQVKTGPIGPGAVTKYCDSLIDRILDLIRRGNFKTTACRACRINPDTLYEWEKRYPGLSDRIREAEAYPQHKAVQCIIDAWEKGNVGAAQWYLEKKFPRKWGKFARPAEPEETREDEPILKTVLEDGTTMYVGPHETPAEAYHRHMASKGPQGPGQVSELPETSE